MKVFYRKHCSLLDWLQLIPEQLKKITNRVIVCRNLEEEITRGVVLLSSFNLFKSPIANKGCLTSSYFCAAVHFFFPYTTTHSYLFLLFSNSTSQSLTALHLQKPGPTLSSASLYRPSFPFYSFLLGYLSLLTLFQSYSQPPLNLNQARSSWSQQAKRQLAKNTRKRMSLSLSVVASAPPFSSPQLQQQWRSCERLKTSGMKHIPVYESLWYKTAEVIQLYPARVNCVWLRNLDDQMYGRLKAGAWYRSISALRFPSQILSLICGGAGFFLGIPLVGNSQMYEICRLNAL